MKQAYSIRMAEEADAPALLDIYRPYVEQTAITFEYDVPTSAEFARRITATLQRYPYLVAEADGVPVGYAYAAPFKERAAYDWAVETSIYVRQGLRRAALQRPGASSPGAAHPEPECMHRLDRGSRCAPGQQQHGIPRPSRLCAGGHFPSVRL